MSGSIVVNLTPWKRAVLSTKLSEAGDLDGSLTTQELRELLSALTECQITKLTEYRSVMAECLQLRSPALFYHAFAIAELEGDDGEVAVICLEKYNDKLEVGFGKGTKAIEFFVEHRPTGHMRKRTYQHASYQPYRNNTVDNLISWLETKRHERYCLVRANCQHYIRDLRGFFSCRPWIEKE